MSTAYSSAKQKYIGNGVTTEWGFDFPIQKHSELKVYLKRSGLPQVLLEEGVDYSFVTENTIAFPIKAGEAKLQAADVLALQRESVFESEYNFSNQQRLEPEEVMHADDNLERQIQELKRDSESSIKVLPTSSVDPTTLVEHVERVYGSVDNIDTVANDKANVDTVAGSISNVNKTAGSIDSVNAVAPYISSVNTVSANISSVNTAASNMAAIQYAPTAAANAAQSAANAANSATISANSAIWAEGTDAQVQALGGTHSSKGWAEQSTSVNISLTNTPYTTNRILEIPQDIKLELNDGTLTLKAGSKVYVPNGFEADGTTPKFDVVTIENDLTKSTYGYAVKTFVFVNPSRVLEDLYTEQSYSGTVAPTASPVMIWYDTANNLVKISSNNGSTWKSGYSLPVGLVTSTTTTYSSIDQVFNGFGYIGSTVFALPGVKYEFPNGLNSAGSYVNGFTETTSVLTTTYTYITTTTQSLFIANNNDIWRCGQFFVVENPPTSGQAYHFWYVQSLNCFYSTSDGTTVPKSHKGMPFIQIASNIKTDASFKVTSINFEAVDGLLTSNANNLSPIGRSYLSGLGMPSGRYINLTLGASDSTYTAPANGYFSILGACDTTPSQTNGVFISMSCGGMTTRNSGTTNMSYGVYISAKKGQSMLLEYKNFKMTGYNYAHFRFVYAEGENNV